MRVSHELHFVRAALTGANYWVILKQAYARGLKLLARVLERWLSARNRRGRLVLRHRANGVWTKKAYNRCGPAARGNHRVVMCHPGLTRR